MWSRPHKPLLFLAALLTVSPSSFALGAETTSAPRNSSSSANAFQKYTISADGINATFIPYGARLTSLFVNDKNGHPQDIVLGYDDPNEYARDSATVHTYFGAVVGRYANR
jgi:aldose 1-epimerase